MRSNTIDLN